MTLNIKALSKIAGDNILFIIIIIIFQEKLDLAYYVNRQTIHIKC